MVVVAGRAAVVLFASVFSVGVAKTAVTREATIHKESEALILSIIRL
jgi:hypothetical protein